MAAESNPNFNDQYMLISNKLKKRFLRKPNVAEASNEFRSLALKCEISEQPIFAAYSYLGAAKCENALGNFVAEAEFFLVAARQFIYAEIQLKSMKCYSPSRDNIETAISCYIQASEKYPENSRMRVSVYMEMTNNLQILGFSNEAIVYYKTAIACWPENIAFKVQCLCRMAQVLFKIENYESLLDVCNEICDIKSKELSTKILSEFNITRLLLTLILQPPEHRLSPSLKEIFANLEQNIQHNNIDNINPDLAVLLQSVVVSYKDNDVDALSYINSDIKYFLTLSQRDLMNKLINVVKEKL